MMKSIVVCCFLLGQFFAYSLGAIRVPSGKSPQLLAREGRGQAENTPEYWQDIAQNILQRAKLKKPITNVAKNVILFMGDGMSVPTITAARIYAGGESSELAFDKFPYTAVSKTYCVDRQVSESTCTATAYLGGVKGNWYTSGLTSAVKKGDCEGSLLPENQVPSIAVWSQKVGKWTGFVTTTRITHASPAGLYAHSGHKFWESDADMMKLHGDTKRCTDIARQLIESEVGQKFHVMLGCGRNKFLSKNNKDEEGKPGHRLDERNLIEEWKMKKEKNGDKYEYIWNRKQLLEMKNDTDYLLGLFEDDMCKYNVDRDKEMDPSLEEMTEAAIRKLSKSPNGYFLFVEGGLIDQAHHLNKAGKALDETSEFSKAIARAVKMVNEKETLIVVTADHSHSVIMAGYPKRGSNILGLANFSDVFPINRSIPILSYANGPGFKAGSGEKSYNFSTEDIDMDYQYPTLFETPQETHGGDDVLIYARGPWAHLFSGVMEQNAIPHIMGYASCVGDGSTACQDGATLDKSGSEKLYFSVILLVINTWCIFLYVFER